MFRKASVLILVVVFAFGCASTNDDPNRTAQGAAVGAGAGAVAGAVIGNQSGNPRTGAAVGAVVGGAIGAVVGRRMDQQERELRQIQGVDVSRPSEGEIEVRLTSDILFDFDSESLRPQSRQTLNDLADTMRRYSDINYVEVEGHTDSIGADSYNLDLSRRRATSVRDYLVAQGIPSNSIVARGYGETQPKGTNQTAEGRQLNRRVEIHIRAREQAAE
ncbi:MAG TPA: OmpA family protein [Thermoanaerobaculia bacterium]|nr:OmpA family protein [Thermoanaerobaculia bacterium]